MCIIANLSLFFSLPSSCSTFFAYAQVHVCDIVFMQIFGFISAALLSLTYVQWADRLNAVHCAKEWLSIMTFKYKWCTNMHFETKRERETRKGQSTETGAAAAVDAEMYSRKTFFNFFPHRILFYFSFLLFFLYASWLLSLCFIFISTRERFLLLLEIWLLPRRRRKKCCMNCNFEFLDIEDAKIKNTAR